MRAGSKAADVNFYASLALGMRKSHESPLWLFVLVLAGWMCVCGWDTHKGLASEKGRENKKEFLPVRQLSRAEREGERNKHKI